MAGRQDDPGAPRLVAVGPGLAHEAAVQQPAVWLGPVRQAVRHSALVHGGRSDAPGADQATAEVGAHGQAEAEAPLALDFRQERPLAGPGQQMPDDCDGEHLGITAGGCRAGTRREAAARAGIPVAA